MAWRALVAVAGLGALSVAVAILLALRGYQVG